MKRDRLQRLLDQVGAFWAILELLGLVDRNVIIMFKR